MKISRLLELNRQNSEPLALAQNLGDGFLLKNNPIYRNTRKAASEFGFKFSNELQADFLALPYSQLEDILEKKVIPYVDNVSVLEKVVKQTKDQVVWDEISDGFRRNYVFHESCHAVIRSLSQKIIKSKASLQTLEGQQKKCLHMLLEESFANTCELLAGIEAHDQAHKIFYELNSYTFLFESRTYLKAACDSLGKDFVLKFFVLVYLHSNFLVQNLNDKQFDVILKLAGHSKVDSKDLKNLKALSKIPFTLYLRFRTTTTALHLKLSGIDRPMDEVLNFNFLEEIKNEKPYLELLDSVAAIALK